MLPGNVILMGSLLYPLRTIHKLHLLRGGQAVCITTFGAFSRKRSLTKQLNEISCYMSRQGAVGPLPLKVKGHIFYYLMDVKKGTFHNTKLFDNTAGIKRRLFTKK